MTHFILPLLFTLLLWWGATGLILFLATRPNMVSRSLLIASVLCVAAMGGIVMTADLTSVTAAYVSFSCGLIVWGWLEMTYLTGLITGPAWAQAPCPEGASDSRRFVLGIQTSLYHELLVVLLGAVLWLLSTDAANTVGAWTFTVLWVMRWSAKLNLFLGVPNLNAEFFPAHLRFLETYIPKRAMNLLFPISVTAGTWAATLLITGAMSSANEFQEVAQMCVATLLALAVLEHWFMVLPLQDAELWRWALPGERRNTKPPAASMTTLTSTPVQ